MTADELATRLGAKGGDGKWAALCPAHPDSNPSLSISTADNGGIVLHCHRGCETAAILQALNLTMADLMPPKAATNGHRVVARYHYRDEIGQCLYDVVRHDPKAFHQEPANGARGAGSMKGIRRVLYRLPEVMASIVAGSSVFITEGEKDADAIVAAGYCATTLAGGAGKWKTVEEHARQILAGADIYVVRDRDEPGIAHAKEVAASLRNYAGYVTVVEPAVGKDVAEHLGTGRTVDELIEVADNEQTASEPGNDEFQLDPSWTPVDLAPIIDGTNHQPLPTLLRRADQEHMLYAGSINGIHGDSGAGKGWVVCYVIDQELRAGHSVLLLDYEDTATSIVARLTAIGTPADMIIAQLIYVRPQTEFGPHAVDHIITVCAEHDVTLVVVDSLGEAFAVEGIDENKDVEVGPWYRRVARQIADAGPAVLLIDHSTKAADNPLHPSGSKRKRAAISGASYFAEAVKAFVKGKGGRLKLTCAKDRHGNYRRGEVVANLVMAESFTDSVRMQLHEPDTSEHSADLGAVLAARSAVEAAKKEGRPMTKTALRNMMSIKASSDTKRSGIDLAIGRGALREEDGGRNAKAVTYVHDWSDE